MFWLNGRLVEKSAACIDPADRGFLLADGLFETLAIRAGKVLRLSAHLARLAEGARILDIPLSANEDALGEALRSTARANRLRDGALRLTLTRGPAPRGLAPPSTPQPTLLIAAHPASPTPPAAARAAIARSVRRDEGSVLARVKSLAYVAGVLARAEAARQGADEALLLNTEGRIAEASAANLFVVLRGRLVTPPVSEGALPGIMRAAVIAETDADERPVTRADLHAAEEAFVTSALAIRPLVAADGWPVGDGRAGPVQARLQALAVGETG